MWSRKSQDRNDNKNDTSRTQYSVHVKTLTRTSSYLTWQDKLNDELADCTQQISMKICQIKHSQLLWDEKFLMRHAPEIRNQKTDDWVSYDVVWEQ